MCLQRGLCPVAGDRLGFSFKFGGNATAVPAEEFLAKEAEQPCAGSVGANLPQAEPEARGQHPGSRGCSGVSCTAPTSAQQENVSFPSSQHAFGGWFMVLI